MQKILIVDDDPTLVDFLELLLETEGYETRNASDGTAALQEISTFDPDVILLDYMLPGDMDGLAVLRQIRETHADVSVVIVTGKGNEEVAVECMKAGAADYVVKPFDNERLLSVLKRLHKT